MNDKNLPAEAKQNQGCSLVERLAANPDVDVEKLRQIIEMKHAEEDRAAEKEYNASMALAQGSIKAAFKDKHNGQTRSSYASEASIDKAIGTAASENGFSLSFYEEDSAKDNHIRVCVDVMHSGGHTKKRYIDEPIDNTGIKGTVNKTSVHGKGSSFTYAMKDLKRMVFSITRGEKNDDDGNAAGQSDFISGEQLKRVDSLFREVVENEQAFFKMAGAETLDTIPASHYNKVVGALNAKKAQLPKRG